MLETVSLTMLSVLLTDEWLKLNSSIRIEDRTKSAHFPVWFLSSYTTRDDGSKVLGSCREKYVFSERVSMLFRENLQQILSRDCVNGFITQTEDITKSIDSIVDKFNTMFFESDERYLTRFNLKCNQQPRLFYDTCKSNPNPASVWALWI